MEEIIEISLFEIEIYFEIISIFQFLIMKFPSLSLMKFIYFSHFIFRKFQSVNKNSFPLHLVCIFYFYLIYYYYYYIF